MSTWTLAELADLCGADLDGDGSCVVEGAASLGEAGPREIAFLAHPKYRAKLASTRAAAVVVAREVEKPRADLALLRCADPNLAFTRVVLAFADEEPPAAPGIDPRAAVDPTAVLGAGVAIGPFCTIGPAARIGDRSVLGASVHIGRASDVGADSVLHAGVVVYARVVIGARCLIHSGVVLGADGFGFEPSRVAGENGAWVKIPQCGTVEIGDEVEIGANSTVDRGRFGATRIGRGAKLDNLVHIGHNVVVGERALIVAQTGLSGSARVGAGAILGGQVGVAGHVEIGAGARIAGQAGVFGDVPAGEDWLGFPARPRVEALRQLALTNKMPKLAERVRALEQRLEELARAAATRGESGRTSA